MLGVVDAADVNLLSEPMDMDVVDDLDVFMPDDAETYDASLGERGAQGGFVGRFSCYGG